MRAELGQPFLLGGTLIVRKPVETPDFTLEDVETFRALKRHCERSLQLAANQRPPHWLTPHLAHYAAAMGICRIMIDAKGRVVSGGVSPKEWTNDVMQIDRGVLEPADRLARSTLRKVIDAVRESDGAGTDLAPRSLLIPRPDCGRPLIAYVSPVASRHDDLSQPPPRQAAVAITILDLAFSPTIEPDILRSFGLTPSEVRIASLIGTGYSPRETANRLAIAESTVRTTLKLIYAKTGTSRQSEIAVLLGRLALISIRPAES